MESAKDTDEHVNFNSIKMVVDQFLLGVQNKPVEEELWKWFVFSISGKGLTSYELQSRDFELFLEVLNKMLQAIYQWSNFQK